jgi:hypothetical protein
MTGQAKCIFCGENVDSAEHIISQWLHPYLARTHSIMSRRQLPKGHSGSPLTTVRLKYRQGPSLNIRLRRTCKKCNNTWMSGLETAVMPTLAALVTGSPIELGEDAHRALARWVVLKTIVIDSYQPTVAAITPEQREAFKQNYEIPAFWLISIARNQGIRWRAKWAHRSYTSVLAPSFSRPERANSQATTIGLGQLIIHSYSAPYDLGYSRMERAMRPFTRLWPSRGYIRWPESEGLVDRDIDFLADIIKNTSGVV